MKKRILVVATIYRCGEKIYPVIPHLCEKYEVDVCMFNQMSEKTPWYGNIDPRPDFYKWCSDSGANIIQGPSATEVSKKYNSLSIIRMLDLSKYDLILLDDNFTKGGWGTPLFCREARKKGVVVVATPHGNHEFARYGIGEKIGDIFDYSFVFGDKEKYKLGSKYNNKFLLSGGIPSNDVLKNYKLTGENILIVVSYVDKFNSRKKNQNGYLPFTESTFLQLKIPELQKKYGLGVVVKEKSRFKKGLDFSLKGLEKYDGVKVIMDHPDNNQLIAEAALLVSAPSTLCFKSIQLGIPTVLLKQYGMTGNFYNYDGLVDLDTDDVDAAIAKAMAGGIQRDFIEETIAGGNDFTSTNIYLKYIDDILGGVI
jgi:hypothetical protein